MIDLFYDVLVDENTRDLYAVERLRSKIEGWASTIAEHQQFSVFMERRGESMRYADYRVRIRFVGDNSKRNAMLFKLRYHDEIPRS